MAYPSKILLALVVFVATACLAKALIINGITVNVLRIRGQVFCTVNGNSILGANSLALPNVNVEIVCNGGRTTIGQALTNTSGFIDATIRLADGILFDPSRCLARVKLPVANCDVLPPTGTLQAALSLVNVVQSIVGGTASFALAPWTLIP